jgi:uncharacterized MnhB-related membrane protein
VTGRRPGVWALRYGAAALPLALMAVYAKERWLHLGAFRIVARSVGRENAESLTWLERYAFLRGDLLTDVVLLPLLVAALALALRPRWRAVVTTLVLALIAVAFYIQVRAQASVGTFLHARLFISAIRFADERPDIAGSYIPIGGLVKLGLVIVATAVIAAWAWWRDPARRPSMVLPLEQAGGLALGALLLSATVLAWVPGTVPATRMHRSMLTRALVAYVQMGGASAAEFADLTPAAMSAAYRGIAGVPPSPPDSAWWGRARGFDLLMYVMETVPTACVDFTRNLARYPTTARLRRTGIVAARHHTSYPYSSLANFSTLTGWYPPEYARAFMQRHERGRIPSLLWHLRERGYRTALFEPYPALFEDDPTMYRLVGVQQQVVPGTPPPDGRWVWRDIVRNDSIAAEGLVAQLDRWLAAGQRYAVMYAPQISHAPWRDPVPGRDTTNLLARCRDLVAIQDSVLGGLLGVLERHDRLDSTLIVFTADHGVRTKQEDPRFVPGILDAYSFQVPLLIAAPGAFDSTTVIASVTGAVDVAPTVLDLMGVIRDRDREQGNALWDPRIADRTTFVLAHRLFGVDGFHRRGQYIQWNAMTGALCVATEFLHCRSRYLAEGDSARAAVRVLQRFTALQRVWLEQFVLESGAP